MPKLKNVNPLGQVDVPILRRQGEPFGVEGAGCLEPGEVFETTDEVAGKPPKGTPGEKGYHPGSGLLAQVDNYELVTDKKRG